MDKDLPTFDNKNGNISNGIDGFSERSRSPSPTQEMPLYANDPMRLMNQNLIDNGASIYDYTFKNEDVIPPILKENVNSISNNNLLQEKKVVNKLLIIVIKCIMLN